MSSHVDQVSLLWWSVLHPEVSGKWASIYIFTQLSGIYIAGIEVGAGLVLDVYGMVSEHSFAQMPL
jgi:hypothetical protein